eukprot:GHRR01019611.1.p1 GENE.GHRR01019611.1~~GHRR01019611.1.p1  ORF type:complete len:160 (-),score=25.84 GHRR01019611.1:112-591(-)
MLAGMQHLIRADACAALRAAFVTHHKPGYTNIPILNLPAANEDQDNKALFHIIQYPNGSAGSFGHKPGQGSNSYAWGGSNISSNSGSSSPRGFLTRRYFKDQDTWVLNNGVGRHTTFKKKLLFKIRPVNRSPGLGFLGCWRPVADVVCCHHCFCPLLST